MDFPSQQQFIHALICSALDLPLEQKWPNCARFVHGVAFYSYVRSVIWRFILLTTELRSAVSFVFIVVYTALPENRLLSVSLISALSLIPPPPPPLQPIY